MDALEYVFYVIRHLEPLFMPVVLVGTALAAWRVQVNVLARRAAWDFIAQHEQSAEWLDAADDAKLALLDKPNATDWADFAARWDQRKPSCEDKQAARSILHWANRKEFVAIAILNGTMHRKTYARWWGWEFIDDWGRVAGFVEALMKTSRGDGELFEAFEEVATSPRFRRLAKRPKWEDVPRLTELREYKRKEARRPHQSA